MSTKRNIIWQLITLMSSFSIGVTITMTNISCTEEIVRIDTVKVIEYKDKIFYRTDTVSTIVEVPVKVVENHTDTVIVYVPKEVYIVDSIFIENTKYVHYYHDTLYWYVDHVAWSVDREVQPIVEEFYEECGNRGVTYENTPTFVGGVLMIDYWYEQYSPMPLGWSSFTLPPNYHGWVIMVDGDLSYDEMWSSIIREMAWKQLGVKYSTDPNNIMSNIFIPYKVTQSSSKQEKKKYFDQIFSNLNI